MNILGLLFDFLGFSILSIGIWKSFLHDKKYNKKKVSDELDINDQHIHFLKEMIEIYKDNISINKDELLKSLKDKENNNEARDAAEFLSGLTENKNLKDTMKNIVGTDDFLIQLSEENIKIATESIDEYTKEIKLMEKFPILNMLMHLNEQMLYFKLGTLLILVGFLLQLLSAIFQG